LRRFLFWLKTWAFEKDRNGHTMNPGENPTFSKAHTVFRITFRFLMQMPHETGSPSTAPYQHNPCCANQG
jgi:hypothetical protein